LCPWPNKNNKLLCSHRIALASCSQQCVYRELSTSPSSTVHKTTPGPLPVDSESRVIRRCLGASSHKLDYFRRLAVQYTCPLHSHIALAISIEYLRDVVHLSDLSSRARTKGCYLIVSLDRIHALYGTGRKMSGVCGTRLTSIYHW
jgi:hypothetical protein